MNWLIKKLGDVLDYEQPGKYIVASKNYSGDYKTPVLTAGKTFILGNTNEKENIFPADKLPVIIFDDFTTATQFVDFPFKVKSSAMKILHPKKDKADAKYLFYLMQTIKVDHATHKRFWISEYSEIEIPVPPVEDQRKIVVRLEKMLAKIKEAKKLRAEAQETTKNLLSAELHRIFEEGKVKGWDEKSILEVTELVTKGTTPKTLGYAFTDSGVPFLKAENVNGGKIDAISTKTFISKRVHDILSRSKTKPGDVLMTIAGTIGRIGWVTSSAPEMNMNQAVAIIRPMPDIIFTQYLAYILSAGVTQGQVSSGTVKGAIPNFSLSMIKKLMIPLPPIGEQKMIVARLDALAEKIKKLQEYQNQTQADLIGLEKSILNQVFKN